MPEPAPALALPLCQWATCDDTYAEPGSLYCKPHGRQARLEGAPWRRPGGDLPVTPPGDEQPEHGPAPRSHVGVTDAGELFDRPPPRPRREPPPLSAPAAVCRIDGCDQPPLAKTLTSRSNRWRNLCEQHYAGARRNALGHERRTQLEHVAAPSNGAPAPADLGEVIARPVSYTERAALLVELGAAVDDARGQLAAALAAWETAIADLA